MHHHQQQQPQQQRERHQQAMPAALILDDNQEMMVLSSLPSPQTEMSNPPDRLQYGGDITCVPPDEHDESAGTPFVIDDSEMSEVDEHTLTTTPTTTTKPHYSTNADAANQAQHGAAASCPLVPAALEILNSPSAEVSDLLAVMRALPWEPHIQSIACEKLWIQSFDDDQALRLAQQEGGISLVLVAMARFPHQVHLQHCAVEVLQNIAALDDAWFAHEICQRGGVTLLVYAMRNHPEHQSLQLCGCITLASLAEADPTNNGEHIRQVGGLDAVLYAKWNHEDHEAVGLGVQQALEALGYEDSD